MSINLAFGIAVVTVCVVALVAMISVVRDILANIYLHLNTIIIKVDDLRFKLDNPYTPLTTRRNAPLPPQLGTADPLLGFWGEPLKKGKNS